MEVGFATQHMDRDVIEKVRTIRGVTSVEVLDERELRLKFIGGAETQAEILSELVALKLGVNSFRASSSALEDVYLNLIKENV